MKAIVLESYGGIEQLELREVPDPKPGAGEVIVKIAATSVNPIDYKLRSGAARARIPLELPAILGRDIAGEVVALGSGVTNVRVGDRVLGLGWRSYAELASIEAGVLAPIPPALDPVDAGALPLVVTTGAQLVARADPKPGQTMLVTGAAGAVGRVAVFVAKERGARVIAGVRRKQLDAARTLGADEVVALDDDAELRRIPELDVIADTVSGATIEELLPRLRSGGVLASVVGEPPAAKGKPIEVRAFMAQPDGGLLARYAQAVAQKRLMIPIAERLPLARAGEAQQRAEEHKVAGKLLLIP
ncbi:MAG TPA: NADP-dependent oxidoreductase [Polyangia bacterium]|nr:NADP-dependent oxidoreductase [Polyangia bacterium]